MGGKDKSLALNVCPSSSSFRLLLLSLFLFYAGIPCIAQGNNSSFSSSSFPLPAKYIPPDNYLINCGSPVQALLDDGRTFMSDPESSSFLSTSENISTSVDSLSPPAADSLPFHRTARIFQQESMYKFPISKPGVHWLRLHFHPLPNQEYDLLTAIFSVTADTTVLLNQFSVENTTTMVFKEYLINISANGFSLKFSPIRNSFAFINAIELFSAPDGFISNPSGALEVSYRLNVGGPIITPENDTLWRTWLADTQFMEFPEGAKEASVAPNIIKYSAIGEGSPFSALNGSEATPFIAPNWVYATAEEMADSGVADANFNLTWGFPVDSSFSYLVRMHFCDIVSTSLHELYFNVYVNGIMGVSNLDLSALTSGLAIPYYRDFVVNASTISNSSIMVQVGPSFDLPSTLPNAILNGLEVMKISNSAGSLDGSFSSNGGEYDSPAKSGPSKTRIAEIVLSAMGVAAILLLGIGVAWWRRRPRDDKRGGSFSSWILPLNSSPLISFLSTKSKSSYSTDNKSCKSGGSGRSFIFADLSKATNKFDDNKVIGIGGFGKVYLGELEDGMKVAIKRGDSSASSSSSQGINEFQTEIQMLSKVRHRHLVSLTGYCDERREMILVYEYMSNGPLRDHLYGKRHVQQLRPPLTWTQRLEICIGAARGLHYLHTGTSQGIIHRDVKTTNILLDENFVAKVSDFGLSKDGTASLEQTHVSTAVKGSFGYLDPEYFRRQQLTEKSDVYSFGVVLFEVLCARPAIDPSLPRDQVSLAEWAMEQNNKGLIAKITDPRLVGAIRSQSLMKYVEVAEKCVAEYGVDRPSMGEVLWNLEYALQLQEESPKLECTEEDCNNNEDLISLSSSSKRESEGDLTIEISDDSGLAVASPMFLKDFRGR